MFCKDVYLVRFGNEGNTQVFFRLLINLLLLLPVLTRYYHLFGPSLMNKLQVRNYLLLLQLTITCVQCGAEQAREDERAEPPDVGGDWGSV